MDREYSKGIRLDEKNARPHEKESNSLIDGGFDPDDYRKRREERKQLRDRRLRMRKKRRMIALGLCILAVAVSLLLAAVLNITAKPATPSGPSEEAPPVSSINGIPVIDSILPEGLPGRPGETRRIRYVVIHETGNRDSGTNAASHNSYIHTAAAEKMLSWHYTVDDSEIYHHLPDNEIAFHAGDRFTEDGGNMSGIGIEMCVNPENDFEKTLENAAALTSYLLAAYGLSIDDVKMHHHFSGKICPETLIENGRWEEFLEMVEGAEVNFTMAE